MLRFLIAAPFILHGLAHLSGFLRAWTTAQVGFSDRPWLLSSGITLRSPLGRAFGLLWLIAMMALLGTGFGVLFRQAWWPLLAIVASVISLTVIAPWWNTVPPGARFGALFDLVVILVLLTPWKDRIVEAVGR
jgi:hypothetical protein